jgi:hypothetical protein
MRVAPFGRSDFEREEMVPLVLTRLPFAVTHAAHRHVVPVTVLSPLDSYRQGKGGGGGGGAGKEGTDHADGSEIFSRPSQRHRCPRE